MEPITTPSFLECLATDKDCILASLHACTGVLPLDAADHDVWARVLEQAEDVPEGVDVSEMQGKPWYDISFGHLEETVSSLPRSADRSAALRCVRLGRHAAEQAVNASDEVAVNVFAVMAYQEVYKAFWQASDAAKAVSG